ncbi:MULTISPECIES: ABC transporter ATP-binding protein [Psychrilyobacter]|uniref:ATP-binding cassette domain-containing protein n=1 Tax=Psychrilyobacter piezotolerans TaxID=2293438 RepID=A0ABX9KH79_9FUSO|nr:MULTISPECIES: oligopeptide/dipeptide ABC transporter ATP-binding protein [Psychrilyobacter]MCS5420700.1 ATP-binding cassette domain-containing protein [Psychrilyobacter sp. S5]NDI78024.1 ATP-binding cassette domain-containing protein [Psychrilyobacter piezotolerans]RDE61963.1 ATP-binding cassette domain-containing protein [Psychrilyobacter sp. S5]REI41189.1 ATP-binding cassette domain-containing protein [Psychrilyobacter piezotolerans]
MENKNDNTLIEIKNLKKYFSKNKGFFKKKMQHLKAVDDVSFHIKKGETFGLVGESGCGKSTTGRTIIRLYDVTGGDIIYDGKNISHLNERELEPYRRKIQMIFQDPYASLNTRMTVGDIIGEPLDIHNLAKGEARQKRIYELLDTVGLSKEHASRYPHEFSGGQRQRIGIARALAVEPEFIICDEPISALDVSIQAQVVNMLDDLQKKLGLTYLFIAHDLSMVKHISDRIGVLYLGKMVEIAESDPLYDKPIHPYTRALLSSIPIPDPELNAKMDREILKGDVPSPLNPPSGCRFRTRCKYAEEICSEKEPLLEEIAPGRFVACHFSRQFYDGTKK